jgi:hypothetical protein
MNVYLILDGYRGKAFESPHITRILFVGLDKETSLQKNVNALDEFLARISEMWRGNQDEHTIFANMLQSVFMLKVGFLNIFCELQQIRHFWVTNLLFKH